jgi:hypothetical protein
LNEKVEERLMCILRETGFTSTVGIDDTLARAYAGIEPAAVGARKQPAHADKHNRWRDQGGGSE